MKSADLAVAGTVITVEPDANVKPLAREVWQDLLASRKERIRLANALAGVLGPHWQVCWQADRLVIRGHQAVAADTLPEIVCDGERIWGDAEPDDGTLKEELAYVTAKVAKSLGWSKVALHGSLRFRNQFRSCALHETDFYTWTMEGARTLRKQRPGNLDWESMAEELEDLGISQERALESHLRVLLAHLLKWAYEPDRRGKSWELSIKNSRDEVREIVERNPGLRQKIPSLLRNSYRKARRDAAIETALGEDAFPPTLGWSYQQVVNETFWPDAQRNTSKPT